MRALHFKLMLAIFLALAISPIAAFAIGVSPSQQEIAFAPAVRQELSLRVINEPMKDMKAVVYARGELAEYISFPQTIVSFGAADQMKTIPYYIDLPSSLPKPGLHEVELVVMEYPESFAEKESTDTVKVIAAVVSKLYVRVPYPAKYAEGELQIGGGNIGDSIPFTISLFNFGTDELKSITATVEVFGPTYERLGTMEAGPLSLAAGNSGKLVAQWQAKVNPGTYHAVVTVNYDEKRFILEKNFDVGNIYVDITGIEVKNFKLGGVAKMDISLMNRWNDEIKGVYGDVSVKDDKTTYTTFKTASVDIPAQADSQIVSYWDTTGIAPGTYKADIKISYAGKVSQESYDLNVNLDSINVVGGPTGEAIKGEGGKLSTTTLIIVLVIVLIAANIGWFVYFSKRLKKK